MSLDDFREKSTSEEERREKLSKNSPPGTASKWRDHEPAKPHWLSYFKGKRIKNIKSIAGFSYVSRDITDKEVVLIRIEDKPSTTMVSDVYMTLDECR